MMERLPGSGTAADGSDDLYEMIITLDDSRGEEIEGYLAHKHGLASSLPSDHPYKYRPPTWLANAVETLRASSSSCPTLPNLCLAGNPLAAGPFSSVCGRSQPQHGRHALLSGGHIMHGHPVLSTSDSCVWRLTAPAGSTHVASCFLSQTSGTSCQIRHQFDHQPCKFVGIASDAQKLDQHLQLMPIGAWAHFVLMHGCYVLMEKLNNGTLI